jgi:hypothetical protein
VSRKGITQHDGPGGTDMSDEGKKPDEGNAGEEKNFLGSWKTEEDATEGLKNLQSKLSDQGNEAGTLRKTVENGEVTMREMQERLDAAEAAGSKKASDRDAEGVKSEQAKINKAIEDLDPVDEGYSTKLTALIAKSNTLAAKGQHDKTLTAATEAFRKELDERDVQGAHKTFNSENPEFNTPEMQAQIRDYIKKDTTGMSDPLSAFREIQRDQAIVRANELTAQNAELTERLELKEGAGKTGTVITKSQGNQEPGKTQPKTRGAERNAGMQAALDKMRG